MDSRDMTTILVCGDRHWNHYTFIKKHLAALPPDTTIIHGGCRGADQLAGLAASVLGLRVQEFPADWRRYGKAAGPLRNARMLTEGHPDIVWAFHDDLTASRGTNDMVRRALDRGLPVYVFHHREEGFPSNWIGVNVNGPTGS